MPSWWVPVKVPTVSAPLSAPQVTPAPTPATGFVPFRYTNRPTGPLIGAFQKPIGIEGPTETSRTLGLAKTIIGAVKTVVSTTIQTAAQLGAATAQSLVSSIPIVSTALSAVVVGLSAGQLAEAKTREAKENAGQSVATGVAGLIPGVGLIGVATAIEGFNDAALAKERAKAVLKEYTGAAKDIQGFTGSVARASDRLDEMMLLPRVSQAQTVAWCKGSMKIANDAMTNFGLHLSKSLEVIANGESFIGIPGRNITELRALLSKAVRDAFILYFGCHDVLSRLHVSYGTPWPNPGKDGTLRGLAGFVGLHPNQTGSTAAGSGIIPGYEIPVEIGSPYGGANAQGVATPSIAPDLETISNYVTDKPGWSLWAIVQYFDRARGMDFRVSEFYQRVTSSRALDTVLAIPAGEAPPLPSVESVQASLAGVKSAGTAIATRAAEAEALRVELFYESQRSNTA